MMKGICGKGEFWVWNEKRVGVMDSDSGNDGRDEFTLQLRLLVLLLREEWEEKWLGWGWRNEAESWLQRHGDAYQNERCVMCLAVCRTVSFTLICITDWRLSVCIAGLSVTLWWVLLTGWLFLCIAGLSCWRSSHSSSCKFRSCKV